MVNKTYEEISNKLTFRTIYMYLGRRVYLSILFLCATVILILLLLWRQQAQVLTTNLQLQSTKDELHSYASRITQSIPQATNNSPAAVAVSQNFSTQQPLTIATYTPPVEGLFVRPADEPAASDIAGSFNNGFTVSANAVSLGTDTTGDYLQSLVAGNGLNGGGNGEGLKATLAVLAGDGIQVGQEGVSVQLQAGGGLAFNDGQLTLRTDCATSQVLKWDGGIDTWACDTDIAGGATLDVRESDGTPTLNSVQVLEFGPATGASNEFLITDQGGGVARVRTGTAVPLTNAPASVTGAWTFTAELTADGGLACSDCIGLGSETSGNYLAGLLAGSGLSIVGGSGEGATPTVGLDSSLSIFKTIDAATGTDPVADSLTDTLALLSGDGIQVTGDAATDSISLSISLNPDGGLAMAGGGISLLTTCGDGQFLRWDNTGTAWICASVTQNSNFLSMISDSGTATADNSGDSITLTGGNGIASSATDSPDTVTFAVDLAAGSGMQFTGGGLSLLVCADGEILKRSAGSWACATDNNSPTIAYKQQLAGTDNVTVGSSFTPLLTNGSGTAQSLPVTILSGSLVAFTATVELTSSLATGPVTYVVIRDDNSDNDCGTGAGDGTQVGGQATSFIASVAQNFTTTLSFADTSPPAGTVRYQLCASTTIALGVTAASDRSLKLEQVAL